MSESTPKISVVMPVYNGGMFLREAIESILNQDYSDFEFIIIDDCSSDDTQAVIASFDDKRMVVHSNDMNLGLAKSLNMGLTKAKGKYIARMDADDISLVSRLRKQFEVMEKNPELGVCGSWARILGGDGHIWKNPTKSQEIKSLLIFNCCLIHPTVMFRREVLEKYNLRFDEEYLSAQDYELWSRMADLTEFANISEPLLLYRVHDKSITSSKSDIQADNTKKIHSYMINNIGIMPSEDELFLHSALSGNELSAGKDFVEKKEAWLQKLKQANEMSRYRDQRFFDEVLGKIWMSTCTHNANLSVWILKKYWQSSLAKFDVKNIIKSFLLLIKVLVSKKRYAE